MANPILEVKNLKTYIHDRRRRRLLRIVDGISFELGATETLGIFGESGSGKTSVAYSIMGLMPESPGIVEGEIWLPDGSGKQNLLEGLKEVCSVDATKPGQFIIKKNTKAWRNRLGYEARMKKVRGRQIALMPQGAKTALWPFGTIEEQIRQAYQLGGGPQQKEDAFVEEILQMLKLREMAHGYPSQLSGGTCQRAIIGITLALNPMIIIADEPTTGLDTTLQVQIIKLLEAFKQGRLEHQSTSGKGEHALIVISHDLRLMKKLADKVVVMYAGEAVETGEGCLIRDKKALHPYTQQLLDIADLSNYRSASETSKGEEPNASKDSELPVITGEVPTLLNPPPGCQFYLRCPIRIDNCREQKPKLVDIDSESGHKVSCHVVTRNPTANPIA